MRLYTDSVHYHCTLHQADRSLPYLLMMHGFMGSQSIFEPLLDKLFPFCNPLTIDLAGHGKTVTPSDVSIFSAGRQRLQIRSILSRLQLNPMFIYGYSMGGRLAFQLLTHYPEIFAGAIIESAHCGITDEKERTSRAEIEKVRALEIETNFDEFTRKWSSLPLFDMTSPEFQKIYFKTMSSQDPLLMAASIRGFGAGVMPFVCDKLKKTDFPVKLIAGSMDKRYLVEMENINNLNQKFSIEIVKECGHRVHACKPKQWIDILHRFIKN